MPEDAWANAPWWGTASQAHAPNAPRVVQPRVDWGVVELGGRALLPLTISFTSPHHPQAENYPRPRGACAGGAADFPWTSRKKREKKPTWNPA